MNTQLETLGRLGWAAVIVLTCAPNAGAKLTGAWTAEGGATGAAFGQSAATAGDVNGDGYSDAVVGAPGANGVEGAVFAYYGSAGGVAATPSWTVSGNFDGFGASIAAAGDVNGDGFDDLLVCAPGHSNGQASEGRVALFLGTPTGLAPAPVWTFESDWPNGNLSVVAFAGDTNADGFDDFVVGAPGWEEQRGRAWLWRGAPNGIPSAGGTWTGNLPAEKLGSSLSGAGRVFGDAYDTFLIGVPGIRRADLVWAPGSATLYGFPDPGTNVSSGFGAAVSGAGDVNGDGYADFMVGAPRDSIATWDEGLVHVYFGGAQLNTTPDASFGPQVEAAGFGTTLACAGDVNGDGYSDIVIGAPTLSDPQVLEGRAYGYYGSPTGPEIWPFWAADGEQANGQFSHSLSAAGDVNGDGYSDVIAGTPHYDNPLIGEGRVAIWHGGPDAPSYLPRWTGQTTQLDAEYGSALALGDFDADGYSDVVVGTGLHDESAIIGDHGRIWVHRGGPDGAPFLADVVISGTSAGDRFGESAACAHDVNGDGFDDLVVGAPGVGGGRGSARLYLGGASGLSTVPAWTANGISPGDEFGKAVGWAGDVNSDGYSDVIVGAPLRNGVQADQGAAYVYLGGPGGLAANPVWTVTSVGQNTRFGWSVACAGDVNRDGHSDVIVGAPGYTTATGNGTAFVYYGDASGISPATPWMASENDAGVELGWSVAGGDVDGDGFSDVIVGAPAWTQTLTEQGRVAVYTSGPGAFDTVPDGFWLGGQLGGHFGTAVAACDFDLDGEDEILGGQPFVDNGQVDEGQVLVYKFGSNTLFWGADGNATTAHHGRSITARGDVNGDGFPDVLTGAPGYDVSGIQDVGLSILWYGNGGVSHFLGEGVNRRVQLRRGDDSQSIGLLGGASSGSIGIRGLARSAMGRSDVALEVETKQLGDAFDGSGTIVGSIQDTGAPVPGSGSAVSAFVQASGLPMNRHMKWRARFLSSHPFQKRSPWFTMAGNAREEADVLVTDEGVAVPILAEATIEGEIVRMFTMAPMPFAASTTITFEISRPSAVRITVHDVAGRLVDTLLDEPRDAGRHAFEWNGAGSGKIASGVYFAVVEASGERHARKLVVAR